MRTKFEGIPQLFVDLYRPQLWLWAAQFQHRGPVQQIELANPPGAPVEMNPDPAQGPVRRYVTLRAEHQTEVYSGATRMIIEPYSDEDREKIARHCRELRGTILQ